MSKDAILASAFSAGEGPYAAIFGAWGVGLWLIGVITKNTLGGLLHILLVIAVIFLLINVIRGRGM